MKKAKVRKVEVFVGTRKGGFLLRSDLKRKNWKVEGPFFAAPRSTASAATTVPASCGPLSTASGGAMTSNAASMTEKHGGSRAPAWNLLRSAS